MVRYGKLSWKHEFDIKYNRLMSTTENKIMDAANDVLCKAIEGLDNAAHKCRICKCYVLLERGGKAGKNFKEHLKVVHALTLHDYKKRFHIGEYVLQ